MRQYQVPQFITVEDKVLGPLTVKQAVYLGVGAVLIFFSCSIFNRFLCFSTALPIGALAVALSFFKINGLPFPIVLKNAFLYAIRPRRYIWKKTPAKKVSREEDEQKKKSEPLIRSMPKLSDSKLSDLAWSLDIKHEQQNENLES
jgi:hypothetical protein